MNQEEISKRIENLKSLIGKKYEQTYSDGTYKGCFFVVYEIYPYLPKITISPEEAKDSWDFILSLVKQHTFEVNRNELRLGDILVTKLYKQLHVAMYIGSDCIIQVLENGSLQIDRCNMYRRCKYFRINENA
jgi:hypothetical protein